MAHDVGDATFDGKAVGTAGMRIVNRKAAVTTAAHIRSVRPFSYPEPPHMIFVPRIVLPSEGEIAAIGDSVPYARQSYGAADHITVKIPGANRLCREDSCKSSRNTDENTFHYQSPTCLGKRMVKYYSILLLHGKWSTGSVSFRAGGTVLHDMIKIVRADVMKSSATRACLAKRAAEGSEDDLIVTATGSEAISEFTMVSTEAVGGVMALEAAQPSDPALDTTMVLLEPVVQVVAGAVAHHLAQRAADRPG